MLLAMYTNLGSKVFTGLSSNLAKAVHNKIANSTRHKKIKSNIQIIEHLRIHVIFTVRDAEQAIDRRPDGHAEREDGEDVQRVARHVQSERSEEERLAGIGTNSHGSL